MQLSEHFTLEQFSRTDEKDLAVQNLEEANNYIDNLKQTAALLENVIPLGQIDIHSGFRGRTLNDRVGGSKTSQHCLGSAIDFNVRGQENRAGQISVLSFIIGLNIDFGQLLLERGCVHLSLGTKKQVAEYTVATKSMNKIPELEGLI